MKNILLSTDVYKMGHMLQYPPGTTEVYSYLEARKPNLRTVFFGLQYYLEEYLSKPVTGKHIDEFMEYYYQILSVQNKRVSFVDRVINKHKYEMDEPISKDLEIASRVEEKLEYLEELGYWPIKIKALPEGSVVNSQNVLMAIENTHPDFAWCVGFLESLLLKVWNPCTVATCSMKYYDLVKAYSNVTCDNDDHIPYSVHDFGYRGVSSEETAMISGGSHLLFFNGSDTVLANKFIKDYYPPESDQTPLGKSVPASEHSVMCAYGRDGELKAFEHLLNTYPSGILSIVSDTYNFWNVMANFTTRFKEKIENRDGKIVFRPDSGDPVKVICGDPDSENVIERMGALNILWEKFGGTINGKGYKVLNPKVGLIYGDGMHYDRFIQMLSTMEKIKFASSNLIIGVGGILLQNHNRDEHGYALKASRVVVDGNEIDIWKDPVTDRGKKSKTGKFSVYKLLGNYLTEKQNEHSDENVDLLKTVFCNGQIMKRYSYDEVLKRILKDKSKAPLSYHGYPLNF